MFISLTLFVILLGALAFIQSARVEKRAHQKRLDAIRKKIEAKDKKKLIDNLQKNRNKEPE